MDKASKCWTDSFTVCGREGRNDGMDGFLLTVLKFFKVGIGGENVTFSSSEKNFRVNLQ